MELSNEEVLRIAERVAEVLARRVPVDGIYTSQALPPDCPSRRRFHELVPGLPGARKAGRVWSCPRASWDAARAVKAPRTAREIAAEAIASNGYRIVKTLRR